MFAVMMLAFGIGMVYFGVPLGVGNLGYNIYVNVLFNALLELPSYLVTFIIVDKWNKRSSIFWFSVLSGISSILCVYPSGNFPEEAKVGLELGLQFNYDLYTTELFPTSVRNSATSMMRQSFALSGVFSSALVSTGKTNSVLSYAVFGIMILFCSLFVFLLPEIRGAALLDSVHEEEESKGSEDRPHKQDTNLNQNFYSSFNILLKRKWARNRMLAVMVLAFGIGMVYFGMPLAVGNLGYSIYLSVLFNALLELPSYLFTFIFLDIWNRRSSIFWFFILTGILSILCAYPGRDFSEGARIVLELGSYFWGCTACNLLLIYTTELFPTSIRNSATSMMRQALALSGLFSPALISAGKTNKTRGTAIADTVYEEEESIGSGD
ncbi:hypothetical protein Tsubulata_050632, partial [Turnera subulata]